MSRTNMIGSHKTSVFTTSEICVKYHDTIVISFTDTYIRLDSGGFLTATTKLRMNQASRQFGLGIDVWQSRGKWYVGQNGKVFPFTDGMTLTRHSLPIFPSPGV